METFNSLIKTENLILENDENIKDINLKSVIFLAPKDGVLNELCDIMREHKNHYMKFNTSNKRMRDLVEFIGKSRPDLKSLFWLISDVGWEDCSKYGCTGDFS